MNMEVGGEIMAPKTQKGKDNRKWSRDGRTNNLMTASDTRFDRNVKRMKKLLVEM